MLLMFTFNKTFKKPHCTSLIVYVNSVKNMKIT